MGGEGPRRATRTASAEAEPSRRWDSTGFEAAFAEAEAALAAREVPVGAALVDDASGAVLARGRNATNASFNPTRHAEIVLLDALLHGDDDEGKEEEEEGGRGGRSSKRRLDATTLYVTLEPCVMCAAAISRAGVPRVVYGAANDKFGGAGSVLRVVGGPPAGQLGAAGGGAAVDTRVDAAAGARAVALLQRFFDKGNVRAPGAGRAAAAAKGAGARAGGEGAGVGEGAGAGAGAAAGAGGARAAVPPES